MSSAIVLYTQFVGTDEISKEDGWPRDCHGKYTFGNLV